MGPEGGKNATGLSKYRDLFVSWNNFLEPKLFLLLFRCSAQHISIITNYWLRQQNTNVRSQICEHQAGATGPLGTGRQTRQQSKTYKGRLCERIWKAIFNRTVISQCPQGREKQIVNRFGPSKETIGANSRGRERPADDWTLEILQKRASKPNKKITAACWILPVHSLLM
jgi:hypothetical protein